VCSLPCLAMCCSVAVSCHVLQCCSVLPCVAVLQCLAMCCSVAVRCHVLQCYSALPCVAVLQCVAMCCSVAVCCLRHSSSRFLIFPRPPLPPFPPPLPLSMAPSLHSTLMTSSFLCRTTVPPVLAACKLQVCPLLLQGLTKKSVEGGAQKRVREGGWD